MEDMTSWETGVTVISKLVHYTFLSLINCGIPSKEIDRHASGASPCYSGGRPSIFTAKYVDYVKITFQCSLDIKYFS